MHRKKTGGRKVGIPNKITQVNRAFISDLLNNQGDCIAQALKELYGQNKQAYLGVICKLMDMVIPRLKDIEADDNEEEKRPHIFKLSGGNKITFNSTDN
jgi:hypothetical protein